MPGTACKMLQKLSRIQWVFLVTLHFPLCQFGLRSGQWTVDPQPQLRQNHKIEDFQQAQGSASICLNQIRLAWDGDSS